MLQAQWRAAASLSPTHQSFPTLLHTWQKISPVYVARIRLAPPGSQAQSRMEPVQNRPSLKPATPNIIFAAILQCPDPAFLPAARRPQTASSLLRTAASLLLTRQSSAPRGPQLC